MAKVFVVVDGAEMQIGSFGTASRLAVKDKDGKVTGWKDTPVEVPEEAADTLQEEVEVQRPNPDWREGVDEKVTPRIVTVKVPAGLRIERKTAAAPEGRKARKSEG